MIDLLADSGLTLGITDDAAAIETLRADVRHYRLLYLETFALAVALQRTITEQEVQLQRQRDEWARVSRRLFLPCGDEG